MKIALIGYGKMGRIIEQVALENGHTISLVIDVNNAEDLNKVNLKKADVAIEFTTPETAVENVRKCFIAGVPVVCGTTGWLDKMEAVKQECIDKNATFLYSSNYSIGVNIFFEINKRLATLMAKQHYEVTIHETHHTQKKDAPSGTAITLAEQVLKELPGKEKWVNHQSGHAAELSIISNRIDPAPGTHTVKYTSEVDDIEIIHTAHSRRGFAEGAVQAAEFLQGKKGIFSMNDVLGI